MLSHLTRPHGVEAAPWWEDIDEVDALMPFETEDLYADRGQGRRMTPEIQAELLRRLGIDLAALFASGGRRDPVLIAGERAGAPLSAILG